MRILLLYFLLAAIPQICAGQTIQQTPDELRQKLVKEYPILAAGQKETKYSEIQDTKSRIREIYANIEDADSLLAPFDKALLDEADGLTEELPGSFQTTLYAASLCGIRRIFKAGGAQAIAAMAFGTETIPKADKIMAIIRNEQIRADRKRLSLSTLARRNNLTMRHIGNICRQTKDNNPQKDLF